jgi:16S rRNA C1402 N4-methylase RsmH
VTSGRENRPSDKAKPLLQALRIFENRLGLSSTAFFKLVLRNLEPDGELYVADFNYLVDRIP